MGFLNGIGKVLELKSSRVEQSNSKGLTRQSQKSKSFGRVCESVFNAEVVL